MNTAKLSRLAPLLIMVSFLAYCGYAMLASGDDPEGSNTTLAKEVDAVAADIAAVSDAIKAGASSVLRDPFRVAPKTGTLAGDSAARGDAAGDPDVDPVAEIVQGLTLEATFVQGRDQMAIIGGHVYSKGEHLRSDNDPDGTYAKLIVVNVLPTKVILHADGQNYELRYSDRLGSREDRASTGGAESPQEAMAEIDPGGQLAMFQKLMNGPLGALGKRMIGDQPKSSARASSTRSKRARKSRSTAGYGGNP
jgi:hypothetical protein